MKHEERSAANTTVNKRKNLSNQLKERIHKVNIKKV
jgi:hypothetical protein